MEFRVNDSCISCGLCTGIAPEVFALGASGQAEVIAQPADDTLAKDAMAQCPVSAIEEA